MFPEAAQDPPAFMQLKNWEEEVWSHWSVTPSSALSSLETTL